MADKGRIRFGFIGAGRRGLDHLGIVKKFEVASIEAVCDMNEPSLREAASKYGARAYTSLDRMLEKEKLDAAVISTPTPLHVSQALKCLGKGIHVILEKPIALRMLEVQKLLKAVEKSDLMVMVGFQARYSDTVEKMKENVDKDTLSMIAGYWYWTIPLVKWIALRSQGGGQMVDQAIHLIDLMRFIAEEEAETVYAVYTEKGRQTAEDKSLGFDNWASYSVSLRFKNDALGNLYSTYALYPEILEAKTKSPKDDRPLRESPVTMDVVCRELLIRYVHAKEIRVYRRNKETEIYEGRDDPTERMHKTFIEAVLTEDKSLIRTPYEDSYKTMAVSLAANESAATGKVINIDEYLSSSEE